MEEDAGVTYSELERLILTYAKDSGVLGKMGTRELSRLETRLDTSNCFKLFFGHHNSERVTHSQFVKLLRALQETILSIEISFLR
jgi:archaellum biogenesis protein FlaJ (TadC family)